MDLFIGFEVSKRERERERVPFKALSVAKFYIASKLDECNKNTLIPVQQLLRTPRRL